MTGDTGEADLENTLLVLKNRVNDGVGRRWSERICSPAESNEAVKNTEVG